MSYKQKREKPYSVFYYSLVQTTSSARVFAIENSLEFSLIYAAFFFPQTQWKMESAAGNSCNAFKSLKSNVELLFVHFFMYKIR